MNWRIKKLQQGGAVADPMEQLIRLAMSALETQNAEQAFQVCQLLVESVKASPEPQEQPVFKKGGKLIKRK